MHDEPLHPVERVAVLSDVHLGHPGSVRAGITAESLAPLWQGVDRLILNGDTAELQIPACRPAALAELAELHRLTQRDGVRLLYLSGNHDAMVTDRRHLYASNGQVLITHGDLLHPTIAPWSQGARRVQQHVNHALAQFKHTHRRDPDLRELLCIYQHAGHAEFLDPLVQHHASGSCHLLLRPDRLLRVLHYWHAMPTRAAAVLEQHAPHTRIIILGHAHRQGVWERRGKVVINTGSFRFPGRPRAVRIDGSTLRVHRIHASDGQFTIEDKAVYEHALTHDHPADATQPTSPRLEPLTAPTLIDRLLLRDAA